MGLGTSPDSVPMQCCRSDRIRKPWLAQRKRFWKELRQKKRIKRHFDIAIKKLRMTPTLFDGLEKKKKGERAEILNTRFLVLLCAKAKENDEIASFLEKTFQLRYRDGKRCSVLNLETNQAFDVHSLGDVGKAKGSFKCDAAMKIDGDEPVTWYMSMKYGGGGKPSIMNATGRHASVFWDDGALAPFLCGMDRVVKRANTRRRHGKVTEHLLCSLIKTSKEKTAAIKFLEYFAFDGGGEKRSVPANSMWSLGDGDTMTPSNWTFRRCVTPEERSAWAQSILPNITLEIRGPDRNGNNLRGNVSRKRIENDTSLGIRAHPWVYWPPIYDGPTVRGALTLRIKRKR